MTTILFDNGPLSDSLYAWRIQVSKTPKGIAVTEDCRQDGYPQTRYYSDGNYPKLPENWNAPINQYGVTEAEAWLEHLKLYIPYRVTNA